VNFSSVNLRADMLDQTTRPYDFAARGGVFVHFGWPALSAGRD